VNKTIAVHCSGAIGLQVLELDINGISLGQKGLAGTTELDFDASAFVGQQINSMKFVVQWGFIPDMPTSGTVSEIDASFASPPASNPPGVWKNQPGLWPVSSLTIGGMTYTKDQLLEVLSTPTKGDAVLILADQLIAAELSIKNGSAHSSTTDAKISDADTLL